MATNKNDVSIVKLICEYILYAFIIGCAVFLICYGSKEPPHETMIIIGTSILTATLTKMGISVSKITGKENNNEK